MKVPPSPAAAMSTASVQIEAAVSSCTSVPTLLPAVDAAFPETVPEAEPVLLSVAVFPELPLFPLSPEGSAGAAGCFSSSLSARSH
ncbi:MAG: hypothetical protein ACOYB8_00645 [Eubacteriaceae bacterium]|jgi:hypothetical protein